LTTSAPNPLEIARSSRPKKTIADRLSAWSRQSGSMEDIIKDAK